MIISTVPDKVAFGFAFTACPFLVRSERLPLLRRLLVPLWLFVRTLPLFRLQRFWLRALLLLSRTGRFRRSRRRNALGLRPLGWRRSL